MSQYPTYRAISSPLVPAQRRRYVTIWNASGSGKIIKVIGAGIYARPAAAFAQSKMNIVLFKFSDVPTAWSAAITPILMDSTDSTLPTQISSLEQVTAGAITTIGPVLAAGSCSVDDNTNTNPLQVYSCFPSREKRTAITVREGEGVSLNQDTWNVATGTAVGYIDFYVL